MSEYNLVDVKQSLRFYQRKILFYQPPQMMQGVSPGVKGISNGHRSPVFGAPAPIGTPVLMPTMPGTGTPVVSTTPFRNRQSPGMTLTDCISLSVDLIYFALPVLINIHLRKKNPSEISVSEHEKWVCV